MDVQNDQWGKTNFNWTLDTGTNYQILRTGCFPYIKYHCTRASPTNLMIEDTFFNMMKLINLGNRNRTTMHCRSYECSSQD